MVISISINTSIAAPFTFKSEFQTDFILPILIKLKITFYLSILKLQKKMIKIIIRK